MESLCPKSALLMMVLCATAVVRSMNPTSTDIDQELNDLIETIKGDRFKALQLVARDTHDERNTVVRAASWAIDTVHPHLIISEFDAVFKTHFEKRCAEIMPLYGRYRSQLESIIAEKRARRRRVQQLYNMARACKELMDHKVQFRLREVFKGMEEVNELLRRLANERTLVKAVDQHGESSKVVEEHQKKEETPDDHHD